MGYLLAADLYLGRPRDGLRWSKHLQLAVIRSFGIRVFDWADPPNFIKFHHPVLNFYRRPHDSCWLIGFLKNCGCDIHKKSSFCWLTPRWSMVFVWFNHLIWYWVEEKWGAPTSHRLFTSHFSRLHISNCISYKWNALYILYAILIYLFNYSIYPRYHHFPLGFYGDPGTFSFVCIYIYNLIYIFTCMYVWE